MHFVFQINRLLMLPLTALIIAAAISLPIMLYFAYFYVDFSKIRGIPEIPGGTLLAGHLYKLGNDHASTAEAWSAKYGWPVFQLRMGRRRAIVINSFAAAREWLVKNQFATIDRPWFHTFHGVISKTSAATIGTSPWNERTKKQRRIVSSFTTGPSIQRMREMLDLETYAVIYGLYCDGQKGTTDIVPHIHFKRLALNIMTMFCYNFRFQSVRDSLLLQILSDAKMIASFRSTNSNVQDFIPHLRYMENNTREATAIGVRERRDKWLATMFENICGRSKAKPTDKKCVAEMLLEENQDSLTQYDIKTILGGLMSGGFETIFSTAIIATGLLASPQGRIIQEKAFKDIMHVYETPEQAFELCITEEKSTYVVALVKESLRYYPPHKLLPARQVYKDFIYQGTIIPKGLLIYINTQAVNFDEATYGIDAKEFRPERWIEKHRDIPNPSHFTFGAGARMCTAVNFSNRVLYAIFVRLIVSFKITQSGKMPPNTDHINYKEDSTASNATPSDFKVFFMPRNQTVLERCMNQSQDQSEKFKKREAKPPA